jgi:CRISPR-associated endonuclease Cas2
MRKDGKDANKGRIDFPEAVRRIRAAGLATECKTPTLSAAERELGSLEARVQLIERFFAHLQSSNTPGMLFFVMYDIEDNKVRRHLAKYLQKKGCIRMQKSVFLGNASLKVYREVADTLREVNAMYQNGDSLLVLPVTKENMVNLNVIGKDLNYKMTVAPPKVLII